MKVFTLYTLGWFSMYRGFAGAVLRARTFMRAHTKFILNTSAGLHS